MASRNPISFISGAKVNLSRTLKISSSKEFHHIFPDKYLQTLGKERKEIYQLANFCFLNNTDNQKIKDKSPKTYFSLLNKDRLADILNAALCPEKLFVLDYNEFIDKRKEILAEYAKTLIK